MEFIIKGNNFRYGKRFRKSFLNLVTMLTIGFVPYSLFYGISQKSILGYFLLLVLGGVYCVYVTRRILYRISFAMDTRAVTVEVLNFNNIKMHSSINFSNVKVTVRKNFLSRYPVWGLTIYDGKKAVYRQKEWPGWSHEEFERIEKFSKSVK